MMAGKPLALSRVKRGKGGGGKDIFGQRVKHKTMLQEDNVMNAKADLLKWFKARNLFFGLSGVRQELRKGFVLASECLHEDARWLCGLFPQGAPASRQHAWQVLSSLPKEDPRALCFAGLLSGWPYDLTVVKRAANMGNVLARAVIGVISSKQWFRNDNACQDDPNYVMAVVKYMHDEHRVNAIKLAKVAAELGNPDAQVYYGSHGFKLSDPERYSWFETAARNGSIEAVRIVLNDIPDRLRHFDKFGSGQSIFKIGEIVSMANMSLRYSSRTKLSDIDRVCGLYTKWNSLVIEAMMCWSIIGKRNKVVKDIRLTICKILWANRAAWSDGT